MVLAGNYSVHYYGLDFALWALVIGLLISNVLGLPPWIKGAVRTEYFIKTGLVMMGTGILFGEIIQAGAYGVIQAVLVVSVVWYIAYRLAKKLHMADEFAAINGSRGFHLRRFRSYCRCRCGAGGQEENVDS